MANKLYVDTLNEAELARLEARLRPGESSEVGFLGANESLKEVVYHDAETLRRLGVTHEQVANRLESIVSDKNGNHGFRVQEQTWRGGKDQAYDPFQTDIQTKTGNTRVERGSQEDPFQEEFSIPPYSSSDYTIINTKGESVSFPGLIIKLIRDYQFFEGKGISYRLDPEKAVKILSIKPGEKYDVQSKSSSTSQQKKPGIVYRGM